MLVRFVMDYMCRGCSIQRLEPLTSVLHALYPQNAYINLVR